MATGSQALRQPRLPLPAQAATSDPILSSCHITQDTLKTCRCPFSLLLLHINSFATARQYQVRAKRFSQVPLRCAEVQGPSPPPVTARCSTKALNVLRTSHSSIITTTSKRKLLDMADASCSGPSPFKRLVDHQGRDVSHHQDRLVNQHAGQAPGVCQPFVSAMHRQPEY